MTLLRKTAVFALAGFVGGVTAAVGNLVGTRYVAPLIESKLPSRTSTEPQDTRGTPGFARA